MSQYPKIPERVSSLFPSHVKNTLHDIKKRKVSAMSARSNSSTISEFIEQKIHEHKLNIDYTEQCRQGLRKAFEEKNLSLSEWKQLREGLQDQDKDDKSQYVTLKRQRLMIEDDIQDSSHNKSLEGAYAVAMVNRVKIRRKKEDVSPKTVQRRFRNGILNFYDVKKVRENGERLVYCVASKEWWDAKLVKAAHLVPRSLESEELSYLFGAGTTDLSLPQNGLPLHQNLEMALDRAQIAIVPIPPEQKGDNRWKIILVDESMREKLALGSASPPLYWRDLDGRELSFLNDNRPARRFLYFRYVMTFLTARELGLTAWAEKHDLRGYMWCTPGPYLRKSMLRCLAREVSDFYLPEVFYDNLFKKGEVSPARSDDEETVSGMSLGLKLSDELEPMIRGDKKKDDTESEDDDDEDDEEDEDEE